MKKYFSLLISIILFAITLFYSPIAKAEGTPAYTATRNPTTKFQYLATPGSKISDYLTITNKDANRWIEITVSSVSLPERWFQIHTENPIRLEPGETKIFNFSIVIPPTAELIKYSGILTNSLTNYEKPKDSTDKNTLNIGLAIGTGIEIIVHEGPMENQNFSSTKDTETTKTTIKKTDYKNFITKTYILIENHITTVLLLIIISLIFKIAFLKTKKITTKKVTQRKKKTKTSS